ncbi:MAG: PAS domain-containing protein [Spirochaetes bacterium]|nr:MAG: PAS domain-containing protein [Spirochaetota bacterium]
MPRDVMKISISAATYRSVVVITCSSFLAAVLWGAVFRENMSGYSIAAALGFWALLASSFLIHNSYQNGKINSLRNFAEKQEFEIRWKNLMLDNTDEMFIVLNMYGQIVTFNQTFENLMGLPRSDLQGKPLRAVFMNEVYEENSNLSYVLLDRLRDVFLGKETLFTYSIRFKGTDRVVSINLSMRPVCNKGELQNILVSGRAVHSDRIVMKNLVGEAGRYCMDNNISDLYQLSHRLTRNLERWLPRAQIYLLQMALQEVLTNAVEHGNLEVDYDMKTELQQRKGNYWDILIKECNKDYLAARKVHISYSLDEEKVVYVVKDEGCGFEWRKYLEQEEEAGEGAFVRTFHGIGLQLVKNVFELSFGQNGSEITMVKYFQEHRHSA